MVALPRGLVADASPLDPQHIDPQRRASLQGALNSALMDVAAQHGARVLGVQADAVVVLVDQPHDSAPLVFALLDRARAAQGVDAHFVPLSIGVGAGSLVADPVAGMLGAELSRAHRLASVGEAEGGVFVTDAWRAAVAVPVGVGLMAARRVDVARLGFRFARLVGPA